ncbi:MAG TPA: GYDIA family GHMP kinase [Bacteroidales bacterium]|nr:GYDIA family GHMP kinase [Bacteroidales bacterium]
MNTLEFFSNGKLMISGEYFVLHGGMSLAVPVQFGQSLKVESNPDSPKALKWISREKGREWLQATFVGKEFNCESSTGRHEFLQTLFKAACKQNPTFAEKAMGKQVITNTGFPLSWGLGSSSTLISNLAAWAEVDPYRLLFATTNGSGYDIACARSQVPLLYKYHGKDRNPSVEPVDFEPPFAGNIWFVYSGGKQSSAQSIEQVSHAQFAREKVAMISSLSFRMQSETSLELFMKHMRDHERLVAEVTGKTPVQKERFDDFPGTIKSLGAWGGDFIMAASHLDELLVKQYFLSKGCKVVLNFQEMVLNV